MNTFEYVPLVIRAQSGDRVAFGDLVREFQPRVYGTVLSRLRNVSEAQEVTQDVFLRAMRKLDQLREVEKFPGWLMQIAVRLSINRAVRRPHEVAQDNEIMAQFDGDETQPETQALLTERADQLRNGLAKLKPLDRETLVAFYFQGQSLQEMSHRFDSPVGTIKRRLHTARHRLKAHLEEFQTA